MGKTSKWLRSILTGKKDKDKSSKPTNPNPSNDTEDRTPKEKRRWSFRRSSASSTTATASAESNVVGTANSPRDAENEQKKKYAMAVAVATAAAADAAVAAAQAAATVIRLTAAGSNGSSRSVEEAAAIKIQSVFRSYLARKALCALRGLVKLQALVRGHLVRKQATDTLRCMQALVTAQARARAQRIRMASEEMPNQRQSTHRKPTQDNFWHIYDEMDMSLEENIKIVEMDVCETKGDSRRRRRRNSSSNNNTYYSPNASYTKEEARMAFSPSPSALTEMSPRAYSGHLEDCTSFSTAQSSPQYYSAISRPDDSKNLSFAFPKPPDAQSVMSYDYPLFPNYMANTESSRAKARSQSAPKQRPADSFERQLSRRRASVEGRNVPRVVKMQRSASHVGASPLNYQYPWSIKLDKSSVSLKDSECGSTSNVLTNTNYCRSFVAYDPPGGRYH